MNYSLCELYGHRRMCRRHKLGNVIKMGDVIAITEMGSTFRFPKRMSVNLSISSRRCPPLSVMRVISSYNLIARIEGSRGYVQPRLQNLYNSCLKEFRTAVVEFGYGPVHLVAMQTRGLSPCFYCYRVPANRLYWSGLSLLDNRCLGIVLNLDKTFIEWNDMQSFDLKIQRLRSVHGDTHSAEIDRYEEDRNMLQQYIDTDRVESHARTHFASVNKPVIRVPNRNIVLTRIDPADRSTSILVRVRPGWKAFRTYLVGRRFHVFACMESSDEVVTKLWTDVLDPRADLVERHLLRFYVFGLPPGFTKSLNIILADGQCPPGMTVILDGKNSAWENEDKARVLEIEEFNAYQFSEEVASTMFSLDSVQISVENVIREFFEKFDVLLLESFNLLYERNSTLSALDVNMCLKPKNSDGDVIKSGSKSVATSVIVFNNESLFDRTAFVAALQRAFKERISNLANAHSEWQLYRALHADSFPTVNLIIIQMDKRTDAGCVKLVEDLRKKGYKGNVVGMTRKIHEWDDETIWVFDSVYEEDLHHLEVEPITHFFQSYIPPELSILVYSHDDLRERIMEYAGTPRIIDVELAASEDRVKELQQLGKSYNLILMSIDEVCDYKETAENLLAQFNCKLVGLTEMEPQRIPNNTRKLFLHIHRTSSPYLTTDEIGSILEKIKDSMYLTKISAMEHKDRILDVA